MIDPIRTALERLLVDIRALVDESTGVEGLHKNGDIAPWSELLEDGPYSSWLGDGMAEASEALAKPAWDVRYEFSVVDGDHVEQAGGSAPTFEQALSEGSRYLAQYQQDGPHTLEIRQVEILISDAMSLPGG